MANAAMSIHVTTRRTREPTAEDGKRSVSNAVTRGFAQRCPACGVGRMFERYLKVTHACKICHTALHHHRADDAPPYFTIFVVGHVIVAGVLALEQAYAPEAWVHAAIWVPLTLLLSLLFLPRAKGALVALQWALRMHGFESEQSPHSPEQRTGD